MKLLKNKQLVKALLITILFNVIIFSASSQNVPAAFNYQAVARDDKGQPLSLKTLNIRLSILKNSVNGEAVWSENQLATTNSLGLFNLSIGFGDKISGSDIKDIKWGEATYYLKVEIDFGNGFKPMGTTQLLAVPYALYAEKSGNTVADFSGFKFDAYTNALKNNETKVADLSPLMQKLEFDAANYHLSISGASGIIDLRQFIHGPQDLRTANNKLWLTGNSDSTIVDLAPYKQNLTVTSASRLEISNGNQVPIDTSNTNEIQFLIQNQNKLILSGSTATPIEFDRSETNERQDLLKVNGKLILSNSTARAIPVDTSDINEIQKIVRSGDKVSLSNSTDEISVNDADADASNELINSVTYNKNSKLITIQEGTNTKTVDISPNKVAFRAIKTSNVNIASGASITTIFADEKIDLSNSYDALTGIFTVPSNGAGVYAFFFTYETLDPTLTFELLKNNQNPELLLSYNQPVILDLSENENIRIRVTASDAATIKKASFIGYKTN